MRNARLRRVALRLRFVPQLAIAALCAWPAAHAAAALRLVDSDCCIASRAVSKARPGSLLSRQARSEMNGSNVKRMAKAMREGKFDWSKSGPIEVAERDGVRIIIDGHHRVQAAVRAGLKEVPIKVRQVADDAWSTLQREANDVLWGR